MAGNEGGSVAIMASITYRAAQRADAEAVATIHAASWRDAYASVLEPDFLSGPIEDDRLRLWTDRLGNRPPNLLVEVAAEVSGRLIGFVAVFRDHDPKWGSLIDNLHVLPGMRGQKIGENLLRSVARQLRPEDARNGLHLWVFEANEAGLRFYQRLGGAVVGRDTSRIPAANGKAVLLVHWPTLTPLIGANGRT
jgi:GNAT superfamily N-acetyltransferase